MLSESNTKLDKIFQFHVDDQVLVDRVIGRWVHPASGRSYNTKFAPPKIPYKDDVLNIFSDCVTDYRLPEKH